MIQVNDKIRIAKRDNLNLELQEYRKKVDPKTKAERYDWCWLGYYGDLKSAIGGMLKYCITALTDEELVGWKSVLNRINEIEKELKVAILI